MASDLPAVREVLAPLAPQLLVPVGDAMATGSALRSLLEQRPEERARLAAALRALAVERYDRIFSDKDIVRVHQEDVCQALGLPPTRKYQNEGGPGVAEVANLIRLYSSARMRMSGGL